MILCTRPHVLALVSLCIFLHSCLCSFTTLSLLCRATSLIMHKILSSASVARIINNSLCVTVTLCPRCYSECFLQLPALSQIPLQHTSTTLIFLSHTTSNRLLYVPVPFWALENFPPLFLVIKKYIRNCITAHASQTRYAHVEYE